MQSPLRHIVVFSIALLLTTVLTSCGPQAFRPLSLTEGPFRVEVDSAVGATVVPVYDGAHIVRYELRFPSNSFPQQVIALDEHEEGKWPELRRRVCLPVQLAARSRGLPCLRVRACVYPPSVQECEVGAVTLYLVTWTESARRARGGNPLGLRFNRPKDRALRVMAQGDMLVASTPPYDSVRGSAEEVWARFPYASLVETLRGDELTIELGRWTRLHIEGAQLQALREMVVAAGSASEKPAREPSL